MTSDSSSFSLSVFWTHDQWGTDAQTKTKVVHKDLSGAGNVFLISYPFLSTHSVNCFVFLTEMCDIEALKGPVHSKTFRFSCVIYKTLGTAS